MAASRALLSESVVLALAGGAVGVALAQASTGLLRAIAPAELPRVDEIGIDVMVLLFTVSVSVLSGALVGLFAVLRFGSPSNMTLKEGGRPASDAPGRHRARNALVVGHVALALTLLIVSGLLIRTFVAMRQVDPGSTRPAEVQTFVIAIPPGLISDPHTRRARTNASRNDSLECQASRPSVSRPPSRWTAHEEAADFRLRMHEEPEAHRSHRAGGQGLGLEHSIEKVTGIDDIVAFGIMATPALVVDGEVKVSGVCRRPRLSRHCSPDSLNTRSDRPDAKPRRRRSRRVTTRRTSPQPPQPR